MDGASIETLLRGKGAAEDALERDEIDCLTARGSAALRGATGRADAMPEGARRAARACILIKEASVWGRGARGRSKKKNQWIQLWRKNSKNPVSTPVSTLRDETPPPLFVSFFLSSLPLSVPRRSSTRKVCVSFCDRNYS